ncbi:hypothetical protein MSG28_016035 [Choristoneura fumiferana]|uniref:Uncharacterized protein n=1 Tax=Choristoneura fumiferana TaxID=7141 RepID=A0ACC0K5K5_CHOFU|nr:hypothetical protein MSG28_016035 [Choristoneura fumiferana]
MREDPEQPASSFVLENLTKVAGACSKTGNGEAFTRLIASIPIADNSVKYYYPTKSSKLKTKTTKKRNETYKTKDGHSKQSKSKIKTKAKQEQSKNVREKEKDNSKNKNTRPAAEKQKCFFCKVKRVRILDHYLTKHKLDFSKWCKKLKEEKRFNNNTCWQCNIDYEDDAGLKNHLIEYHKIKVDKNMDKWLDEAFQSNYVNALFKFDATIKNSHLAQPSNELVNKKEENKTIGTEPNAQAKVVKTVRQNKKLSTVQNPKIARFCAECGEYVMTHVFKQHIAEHTEKARSQTQIEHPELPQNFAASQFQAPYEQLNDCAEPAHRQAFVDIPSDGNCFFSSIIKLLNLPTTPLEMRNQLLASPFSEGHEAPVLSIVPVVFLIRIITRYPIFSGYQAANQDP